MNWYAEDFLSLCENTVQSAPSRLLGKCATFQQSRVLSFFSLYVQIITHLCDCMWECIAFWVLVWTHTCLHTLFLILEHHDVHLCLRQSACVNVSVCVCDCLCVSHAEHCLLETLSKSPQCDNWLPGVLVSLLLIIVIPSRKKECVLDEIGKVCSFAGETDPKSASTLLARRNFEAMRQRGQIRCNLTAGCYLLSSQHQDLVFRQTRCHGGNELFEAGDIWCKHQLQLLQCHWEQ